MARTAARKGPARSGTVAAPRGLVALMALTVVLSNILVQFPVEARLGGVNLADTLTWGAFTYPIAFFVTDLANSRHGAAVARRVVLAGFLTGLAMSALFALWPPVAQALTGELPPALVTLRIAIASGAAFLVAQMIDVGVFSRLRRGAWWRAPLASSAVGSVVDTALFFSLAFAPFFAFLDFGGEHGSLGFPAALLGFGPEVPLWVSLALGDFVVKGLVALALLGPYGALRGRAPARA